MNPSVVSGPPTCLFTGVALGPDTKDEHTIPESLGGRIKSKAVSSTAFNEASGRTVDPVLAQLYSPLFNRLAPLLPSQSQPGAFVVRVPDSSDRFAFEPGGILSLKNIRIVERDASGRPKIIAASDKAALVGLAKQLGADLSSLVFTEARATEEAMVYADTIPIAREIELAVMKGLLLTFDHMLQAEPTRRFTRSACLKPVRDVLRRAIMDGVPPSYEDMNRYVLGLQYDRLATIRALRTSAGLQSSRFEHALIASGNVATRTLDAVWLVADTDPYGFRLCSDWREFDFTCVVTVGTLKGTTAQGPFWSNGPGLLLPYTDLRSHPSLSMTQEEAATHMVRAMEMVAKHQQTAFRVAVDLVERAADDYVANNIAEMARLMALEHSDAPSVEAGVVARLRRMFHVRLTNDREKEKIFDATVETRLGELSPTVRQESLTLDEVVGSEPSWSEWLRIERAILDDLAGTLGLPGDTITRSIRPVFEQPGTRPIGMPPRPSQ